MSIYSEVGKRAMDCVGTTLGLLLALPCLGIAAIGIHISMGRPVVFKQERLGLDEETFKLYKLRTMTDSVDASGQVLPDELRLTPFGRFLRQTSIDELPQLWNVLRGDMSLVGPRPLFPEYEPWYRERERKRHTVRPGITGLAQVSGRNRLSWDERLELDAQYVEGLSVWLDLKILWRTLGKALGGSDVLVAPGASQKRLDVERQQATISSEREG